MDGDKTPVYMHASPHMSSKMTGSQYVSSPELLSLDGNAESNDFGSINIDDHGTPRGGSHIPLTTIIDDQEPSQSDADLAEDIKGDDDHNNDDDNKMNNGAATRKVSNSSKKKKSRKSSNSTKKMKSPKSPKSPKFPRSPPTSPKSPRSIRLTQVAVTQNARFGDYDGALKKSFSDLRNSSQYSLGARESIVSMGEDEDAECDDGWPHFEPLDGPYPLSVYRKDIKQLKDEILSGLVVSFAQVPEAVAFSFLAGVDPFIGLHAAWIVGFITSFFGGRCAEISGATGATAAVLAPYMADPNVGVMYLPYIIVLVGIIIIIWGLIGVSKLISLVPVSCMIGFVNGLAVIIGSAQLGSFEALVEKHPERNGEFYGELAWMIALTIVTFVIVEYLPRLTKFVPATLIAILVATFVEHVIIRMAAGMETVLIGELGNFAGGLPKIPGVDPYWDLPPLNWETFTIILLPSLTVALVSTVEDLLTIEVVHDLTNTRPRSVEKCELITKLQIIAMGAGNFVCGFFGAIGGGSTIGLATVNCYSANGRYRWSGVTCSISTFFIVFIASPALVQVPASALVGLMLVVVVHTFEWSSIPILIVTFLPLKARNWLNDKVFRGKWSVHRKIRRADGIIILLVTILTILTNLGYAIIAGVLFATLMYTWESGKALKHSCITIRRPNNEMSVSSKNEEEPNQDQEEPNQQTHLQPKRTNTLEAPTPTNDSDRSSDDLAGDDNEDDYHHVKIYTLEGPLLFSNSNRLPSIFNWNGDPDHVEVHLQNCTVYDYSALNALNNVAEKYKKKDKEIVLKYVNVETQKSFEKADTLITHFTYETNIEEGEQQEFHPATRLNVAHGSMRQI